MMRQKVVTSVIARLAPLCIWIIALGGCGFKDDPAAPQTVVPRPVTDLRYQLSEKGVTLYWTYPVETVTGNELADVSGFIMYRAVVPVDDYCETCPIPFGSPINLPGGVLPSKGKKTASYQSSLLRPGNLYFFKVKSKAGWWAESEDSNIVKFLWNTPAQAPTGLSLESVNNKIELSWQPVKTHLDGSPITAPVKYQVYRSIAGKTFTPLGEPVAVTRFTDMDVVQKRSYYYQVQAVSVFPGGTVGGGTSETVSATLVDSTPPAIPTGIYGIKTSVGIKIFWDKVTEQDVKGYRVYRRQPGDEKPQFVEEILLPYTMFIDRNPPANAHRLYYSVSSIDNWETPNESSLSVEIMVEQ